MEESTGYRRGEQRYEKEKVICRAGHSARSLLYPILRDIIWN